MIHPSRLGLRGLPNVHVLTVCGLRRAARVVEPDDTVAILAVVLRAVHLAVHGWEGRRVRVRRLVAVAVLIVWIDMPLMGHLVHERFTAHDIGVQAGGEGKSAARAGRGIVDALSPNIRKGL